MTPERWQQVERLYHEALERETSQRAGFLHEACLGDEALRGEVESLLAQEKGADSLLEAPALEAAAKMFDQDPSPSMIGRQAGAYQVISLLGVGGMGEVYEARDAKLGRIVAIKVLPREFTHDPERLSRFQREARMLAALNHPNIATIYGLEQFDGVHYLVMELVPGQTLAARVAKGRLPVDEALMLAGQIAEALEAAHEKGVIHRDLKPANVKVTPEGRVKVLDFGLAKAFTGDGDQDLSQAPTLSEEGRILGTSAYMSPEQARGLPVDKRTDIWAFGCVLYEMLTGRTPFAGQTISDTLAAVLEREPDWSCLPEALPVNIRRLLQRCLEKDPKRRLRDIGDARLELEDAAEPKPETSKIPPAESARRWNPKKIAIAAGLIALTALGISAIHLMDRRIPPPAGGSSSAAIERITYDAGTTIDPAVSPDGRLLAYASNRASDANLDIWVQQAGSGSALRLTDDPADHSVPDFSPDGSQIVFRSEGGGGGVYTLPALGGPARLVAAEGRRPRFSPDGKQIAYWAGQWRGFARNGYSGVFIIPLAGGAPLRIVPDFTMARDPVWAPDGHSLLILGRRDLKSPLLDTFDWWWVPLDGRPPVKIGLFGSLALNGAEPYPDSWTQSGVVFHLSDSIWTVPVVEGRITAPPRRLASVIGNIRTTAVSPDGALVAAVTENQRVIERAPIGERTNTDPPVKLYTDAHTVTMRASETADGARIVFELDFPKYRELWLKDLRHHEQQMLVHVDSPAQVSGVISPDGKHVVYTVGAALEHGNGQLIETSGGVPRQLCQVCGLHGFLSDNHRVLAVWDDHHTIGTIDTVTGDKVELIRDREGALDRPHASPDDRWLAFRQLIGDVYKSFLVPLTPGHAAARSTWQQIQEPTATGRPAGWSLDSRVLYLLLDTDGFRCLWGQRVDPVTGRLAGSPFAVRHFHASVNNTGQAMSTSYGNPITADGFMYEDMNVIGNLWRLQVPAE
jgi:serine/threonine protein kinase